MKIVFFGTPAFAAIILEGLITAGHEIEAVITRVDKPRGRKGTPQPSAVKAYIAEHHPEIPIYQPKNPSHADFKDQIDAFTADLFVVAAYGHILRSHILEKPRFGAINVHASLLPKYRGAAPIQRAIMDGETKTGVTIMQMVLEMDAGDMLHKAELQLEEGMTGGQVTETLAHLGVEALCEVLQKLENHTLSPEKQDPSAVTFAPKIMKEDCRIDWKRTPQNICHQVHALAPNPGAWCEVEVRGERKRMKVFKAQVVPKEETGMLCVGLSGGVIRLSEVQLEGKGIVEDTALLRGAEICIVF